MDKIYAKLLGSPKVIYKNKTVKFPYKKVEGLFYYLCVKKSIQREEAIHLLWSDTNEQLAKKNLRGALYSIRKIFGEDIFLPTKKSTVCVNSLRIATDIDNLNSLQVNELSKGDFLLNFVIKDCYEFEEWLSFERDNYKKYFLDKIQKMMNESVNIKDYNSFTLYAKILIKNDPYNEKIYRYIMKMHALYGYYNNAIKLYNNLYDILKSDLGVEPELSTKKIYSEIIELKKTDSNTNPNSHYFYGRFKEIYKITDTINNFYKDKAISISISGEAGIGKTAFLSRISKLIDKNKFLLLSSSCYSAERNFFLKPWHDIFYLLGNYIKNAKISIHQSYADIISYIFPYFKDEKSVSDIQLPEQIDITRYQLANEAIIDLLIKISCKKKIILMFDDLQWMDEMSKNLLKSILFRLGNKNVLLICSYRDDYEDITNAFTVPLISKELLYEMKLERFTKKEVTDIALYKIPVLRDTPELFDKIYNDTEGNALFLTELLKTIKEKGYTNELSLKATNIIKSRVTDLSKNEKLILDAISIFFDKANIQAIKSIVSLEEYTLYEVIEALESKHLINEIVSKNNIFYAITHQKIRGYILESISAGKKALMHKKVADYYKNLYTNSNDKSLLSKLIYHYDSSGDLYNTLIHKVEYLKEYYTLYHETFPMVLSDFKYDNYLKNSLSENNLIELYNETEHCLERCCENEIPKFLSLKMELTFIMGRLYIAKGQYEDGLKNINISKTIAIKLNSKEFILSNYKQLIFYSIQVHNLNIMKENIDKIIEITGTNSIDEEVGTVLRLYGLYCIKIKDYVKAEKLLIESIDIFNSLSIQRNKYLLSIAACYNYLGQMYKSIENYNVAYDYFIKAIDTCNDEYTANGIGIFYSNAGQVLYYLNDINNAYKYIIKSIDYFKKTNALWGLDIAKCYQAIIEYELGKNELADEHFRQAKDLGYKLKNPDTISLIEKLKSQGRFT